jgi:hypothetical protein
MGGSSQGTALMWRKIGAALVAVAVLATPVLAIEAMTPPATVPAKVSPVAQTKAKNSPKTVATTSAKIGLKTGTTAGAMIKTAKMHPPTKVAAKSAGAKSLAAKSLAAKSLAAKSLAAKQSGNQISRKAGNKGKQIAAAKPSNKASKQHTKVLTAKTKDSKAAEPVETTGSVAPRSVPTPGLY